MATPAHQEPVFSADFSLPVEMWEQVFQHLGARDLKCVRLTCRQWRAIVSGCARLMDQFPLRLHGKEEIHNSSFVREATRVTLGTIRMVPHVQEWWPALGERLTHLRICQDYLEIQYLLDTLRATPNLKSLMLECRLKNTDRVCRVDFQLDKMEEFGLQQGTKHLPVFGAIFPRLKAFRPGYISSKVQRNVIDFINSVQDSLEDIDLDIDGDLSEISNIRRLRLKRVNYIWDVAYLVEFCQQQTSIEELKINFTSSVTNQTLCEVGRCLPGLKRLQCGLKITYDLFSFISIMPQLEYLKIIYAEREVASHITVVSFVEFKHANLKEIEIYDVSFAAGGLRTLLRSLPNLASIVLENCRFKCLSELFSSLGRLRKLQQLRLQQLRIRLPENDNLWVGPLSRLTELAVHQGSWISNESMAAMLRQCAQLRTLDMDEFQIEDELTEAICRNTQLKCLKLSRCIITSEPLLESIREHCRELGISPALPYL